MGYDLVTWSPRIGSSGDDKYNVPGATKLDATVHVADPTVIRHGNSSGFSSTPAIAEIDGSSDWNQVLALLRRRQKQVDALMGSSTANIDYLTAENRIDATKITSIYAAINAVRSAEGFGSYVFPSGETQAGKKIFGYHLAHARKALRISGTQTCSMAFDSGTATQSRLRRWQGFRGESPAGVIVSENVYDNNVWLSSIFFRVPYLSGGLSDLGRARQIFGVPVFPFVDSTQISSAEFEFVTISGTGANNGRIADIPTTTPSFSTAPAASDFFDSALGTNMVINGLSTFTMAVSASKFSATNVLAHFLWVTQADIDTNFSIFDHTPGYIKYTAAVRVNFGV